MRKKLINFSFDLKKKKSLFIPIRYLIIIININKFSSFSFRFKSMSVFCSVLMRTEQKFFFSKFDYPLHFFPLGKMDRLKENQFGNDSKRNIHLVEMKISNYIHQG